MLVRESDILCVQSFSARWGLSTSVVDGVIYAIGGRVAGKEPALSTVEAYDPGTDTWTKKADIPTPRWRFSINMINGVIYTIGGREEKEGPPISTVAVYNPGTDTWAKKPDMPTKRWGLRTGVINGKIYAIGGRGAREPLSVVEVYDTTTNQ